MPKTQKENGSAPLPAICASMKDFCAFYHVPMEKIRFVRDNGICPEAFHASNRIKVIPFFAAVEPYDRKFYSGRVPNLNGDGAELDPDLMLARVRVQDEREKIRANAIADGELLTRETAEPIFADAMAGLTSALKNYEKITGNEIKTILKSAGVAPEIIQQVLKLAVEGVTGPLEKANESSKNRLQDA